MSRLSLPAIILAIVFMFIGTFAKDYFYEAEGMMGYAIDAGTGAFSALVGGIIGLILFPKQRNEDE